jgi:hypothetical protein
MACQARAVDGTPADYPDRPGYLSHLGTTLRTRFDHAKEEPDLDGAIACLGDAVTATPAEHPDRPGYLSNLGVARLIKFVHTGQQAELDEAINVGRRHVRPPYVDRRAACEARTLRLASRRYTAPPRPAR